MRSIFSARPKDGLACSRIVAAPSMVVLSIRRFISLICACCRVTLKLLVRTMVARRLAGIVAGLASNQLNKPRKLFDASSTLPSKRGPPSTARAPPEKRRSEPPGSRAESFSRRNVPFSTEASSCTWLTMSPRYLKPSTVTRTLPRRLLGMAGNEPPVSAAVRSRPFSADGWFVSAVPSSSLSRSRWPMASAKL